MYSKDLNSYNSVSNYNAVLINTLCELRKTQVKVIVTLSHMYKHYSVHVACELLASLPDVKHGGDKYCTRYF